MSRIFVTGSSDGLGKGSPAAYRTGASSHSARPERIPIRSSMTFFTSFCGGKNGLDISRLWPI
jgi:hypothetical protein